MTKNLIMKTYQKRLINMKKRLLNYIKEIDKKIESNEKITKEEVENHLIQIKFFQHERLVHLLVTIFVGILAILFYLSGIIINNAYLLIIFFCLLFLFIPYLLYYRFLENNTQKLYEQYDILRKKSK